MVENRFKLSGTLYGKEVETIAGKKDPTASYQKYLITLEVKIAGNRNIKGEEKWITTTQLPQFEVFNPRFDLEYYSVGDQVEVEFALEGKEYTRKKGEHAGEKAIMTKLSLLSIKHEDIQTKKDNKVRVTAMSDIDKIAEPPIEFDDPFPEVKTNMSPLKIDIEEDDSDLPF